MRLKAVIFDLDGTLGNTLPFIVEAFRRAVEPVCGRSLSDGEITATFGPSDEGTIAALVPREHYDECLANYMQLYEALHGMVPAPFGGMRELLKALKARGVKIALVTGKGARNCAMTLRRFGLEGFFDHVGCGSPEGDVKSQRLVEVLDKYGLEPSEAIYVGDAPSDVSACRRVGVPVASAAWAPTADPARLAAINPGMVFLSIAGLAEYLERIA